MDSEDPNSCSHLCIAIILTTEPGPAHLPKKAVPVQWPCSAVVRLEPCGLAIPLDGGGQPPSFAASPAPSLSVLSLNLVLCQPPTHRSLYKSVTKCRALGTVQGFPARLTVSEESVNRPEDSETSVAWTHVLGSWTNSQSASARLRALV